jgi:hypothetical protein
MCATRVVDLEDLAVQRDDRDADGAWRKTSRKRCSPAGIPLP